VPRLAPSATRSRESSDRHGFLMSWARVYFASNGAVGAGPLVGDGVEDGVLEVLGLLAVVPADCAVDT
jgi:hypothetical protein